LGGFCEQPVGIVKKPAALFFRRLAIMLGAMLLALLVVAGGIVFAFLSQFHVSPPKAGYAAPQSALEAQRQDLDYFEKAMALDRSFSPVARAEGEKRVAALKALPTALPPPRLHVALMQVIALADNGHTRMQPLADEGTWLVPLRVTHFAEGFFVMRSAPAYRDMLGGRVESIDGVPFDQVLARLETLRGGVEGFRRENAADFIVVQDLLYGLGIATDPRASVWTVRLPDGRLLSHTLITMPSRQAEELAYGVRWLSPEPAKGVEAGWTTYRPAAGGVPETWRDFDNHFRRFAAAGGCTQVVRLQDIGDTDGQRISPFLAETETAFKAHPPCAVIVDLRGDTGGDYTNSWHFTRALPSLVTPGGPIIVLTDSHTFSAAITTAAFIKDAGGGRIKIVGEPVGDRLSFFSEGGRACLPNLKVCVNYQTAKHDYAQACNDWHQCYWLNWFYPVRVKSLQPDLLVPLRFADWNAGRDAAYEEALALIAKSPQT
jgi:hypothetical protein